MLHEPSKPQGKDHAVDYKTWLGVKMFVAYGLIYMGFVAINVIKPVAMETTIVFGLNLAVVYGFGLIITALVLALVYNHMCTVRERAAASSAGADGEDK